MPRAERAVDGAWCNLVQLVHRSVTPWRQAAGVPGPAHLGSLRRWYSLAVSDFDYDFAIVGSGFGGSVSALRLTGKGDSVCGLPMGRGWGGGDFSQNTRGD